MIARQFVLSSSSFFSDTLPSQHSSSSMVCTIELIVLNTHRPQHSSLPTLFSTLFVINTLRARWFVPSSSSLQYSPSGTTASLSTLQHAPHSTNFGLQHSSSSMVCTIELILLNTLRLVPRPNFRFCNTPPHSTKFQRYSFDGLIAVWMRKHPPSILDPRRCGDMFGFG